MAPPIPNLIIRCRYVENFTPLQLKERRYPLNRKLAWAQSQSESSGEEKISFVSTEIRTPDRPGRRLVVIPTTQYRLPI